MKKNPVALMLALTLIMSICLFPNEAAKAANYEARTGIVTSSNVSIRQAADTKSDRYVSLKNGDTVLITGETGEWYQIDLATINQGEGSGYALKKYISTSAYYITLPVDVILWADTWNSGCANGEKSAGTKMLVLSENSEWYCVQTREDSAGSSFIRKSDLYQQSGNQSGSTNVGENNVYVVTATTLAVRSDPDDNKEPVGFLHNGDLVNVIQWGEYFTSIEYMMAGQKTECWVHTEYLKKVIK